MSNNKIIAVTGATGQQGGAVARKLLAEGWQVRALTRDVNKPAAQELKALGAELFAGDMDNRAELDAAFKGAYRITGYPMSASMSRFNRAKMSPMPPKPRVCSTLYILPSARRIAAWDRNISRSSGLASNTSQRWVFLTLFSAPWHSWITTTRAALIF